MNRIIVAAALAVLAGTACSVETRHPGEESHAPAKAGGKSAKAEKKGEVVATVGSDVITVDDFNEKMGEQAALIRARYTTLERKKEFLDNLVRFEVLAQEAAKRGFEQDPEVQATMKKVMVQKLIRAEFEETAAAKDVPEPELRKYYDDNIEDYKKPERVRVSHVFFASPAGDPKRAAAKSEAAKLLADVKAREAGTDKVALATVAKEKSDDAATKAAGGDLTFKTREELAAAWGAAFGDAAFGMKLVGEIGSVVETEKGLHLLKLTGRQNAIDRPFEQVREQILNRLYREKRTKAFDDFVAKLKTDAKVTVKDDVLEKIEVLPPGGAPAMPGMPGMPGGMMPGGMPPGGPMPMPPGGMPPGGMPPGGAMPMPPGGAKAMPLPMAPGAAPKPAHP